jgi:hypothetical protein
MPAINLISGLCCCFSRRAGVSADRVGSNAGQQYLAEPELPARRSYSMNDRRKLQP